MVPEPHIGSERDLPTSDIMESRGRIILRLAREPFAWLCVIHLTILVSQVPIFSRLTGWFFHPEAKPLGPWYLLIGLALVPAVGLFILTRWTARRPLAVGVLVLLGFVLQQGFAWSEGHGRNGMRNRIVTTGHAEFARIAVDQPSLWDVLVRYEAKLATNELGIYAHSKPPGQLLFYMATERLAQVFARDENPAARLDSTRNLAAMAWPLLCYLVLFPLYFTLREIVGDETAFLGCLLYLVVPSVTLITLHTDECLFPLLLMTVVWIATIAQVRRSWAWALAAGAMLYVSAFFSFALLLAAPIAASFAAASELASVGGQRPGKRVRSLARTLAGSAIGFAALFILFAFAFHYDFLARLEGAERHHMQWKYWKGELGETVYFAGLGYLEFVLLLGIPLAVLALAGARRSLVRATAGDWQQLVIPCAALGAVFLFLGFLGHAKGETARLWLPFVQICCGLAAAELQDRKKYPRALLVAAVLALQWFTIWAIKANQDFW